MEKQESPDNEELDPTFIKARDAAFRLLSYRPRSEAEVRRRLLRSYAPEIVDRVASQLRQIRFLDDQTFAQQWRLNREQHRPRAQRIVQQELLRLGVSSEVIQTALEDFDDEANAYQAGLKLAQRLISKEHSEEEFRRRLWSHLRRRGFSYSQAKDIIERLWHQLGADFLHCQEDTKNDKQQAPETEPEGGG
jgi:regulatory protein